MDYSGRKGRDGQKKKIGKANERKGKVKRRKDEKVNGQGGKRGAPAPHVVFHVFHISRCFVPYQSAITAVHRLHISILCTSSLTSYYTNKKPIGCDAQLQFSELSGRNVPGNFFVGGFIRKGNIWGLSGCAVSGGMSGWEKKSKFPSRITSLYI